MCSKEKNDNSSEQRYRAGRGEAVPPGLDSAVSLNSEETMYKMLRTTLLAVSFSFLVWFLAAPVFFAAKPMVAEPVEPQPGVITYSSVGAASVDPPAGQQRRIYTVTSSDGKSFTIHGFNKSGFHLSLASDNRIDGPIWFDRSITFSDQYPDGANTVGTLTESGNVWAARSWFGATWRFGATGLSSWAYSAAPPVLPGDGESVTVPATKLQEGKDALFLTFQTDPSNGTSFLIVGTQKKDKKR